MTPRIFGVDYAFLACGDVFTQGLARAAEDLGVPYAHATWDMPDLSTRVKRFAPDLLFVVHGRKFTQHRGRELLPRYPAAVWLTDEPYEVDDTASWSSGYSQVFVNDPATLDRHPRSSYLPACYDVHSHYPGTEPRPHAVGFIGGGNPTRQTYLAALAEAGLLSYVVGGPWTDHRVKPLCRALTIPPGETAIWYRTTRIVLNVFREKHHFNMRNTLATALNPRVYEALACGALVVSEWRPEAETVFPEMPTFRTVDECIAIIQTLLADAGRAEAIRAACAARLVGHSYRDRLATVIATCLTVPVGAMAS